jgi:hypothetical protein
MTMISNQGHQENQVNHGLDDRRETVQGVWSQGGNDVRAAGGSGAVGVGVFFIVRGCIIFGDAALPEKYKS